MTQQLDSSVIDAVDAPIAGAEAPPISGFRELTRDSLTFGLGAVVGKIAGFVMVLILVRLMTPGALGDLDVVMALLNTLAVVALLQLEVAATRLYFDQETIEDRRRLIGAFGALIMISTIAVAGVLALLAAPVATTLFGSDALAPAVVAAALGVIGMGFEAFALTVLRVTSRPRAFAVVEGVSFALYLVAAPLLLAVWQPDATAVMAGWAISAAAAAAVGLFLVRHELGVRPSMHAARALLGLAAPLAPVAVAVVAAEFVNRAILLDRAGSEDVAFFTIGLRFASIAAITVTAFQLALQPRAYRLGASDAGLRQTGRDGYRVIVAILALVVAGAAIAPEAIPLLAGAPYASAVAPFGWSLLAAAAGALFLVGSISSSLARATRDIAVAAAIGAGLGILANLVLAPVAGAVGTAIAIASGQIAAALVIVRSGARHASPLVPWRMVGLMTVLSAVAVLAFTQPVGGLALGPRLVVALVLEVALVREFVRGRSA
jgi:O-antigen/teichoic acid export membrane protein